MTVLMLDQYADVGGGQVVLLNVLRRLREEGVLVALAAPRGLLTDAASSLGVHVIPWEQSWPKRLRQLLRWSRNVQPRRIVVNGARCLPASIAMRLVTSGTRVSYVNHSSSGTQLRSLVTRGLLEGVHEVIPVAQTQVRYRHTVDLPPLSIERDRLLAREDILVGLTVPAAHVSVKAFGRLDPVKGLDVLAHALPLISTPRARVEVAVRHSLETRKGDDYAARTKAQLAPVLVEGARDSTWFRPGDVVVIPSRAEAACLTAQEAMARGAFIVAADVGDLGGLVREGVTGASFHSGDPAALAAAITRACNLAPDTFARVALAGHDLVASRAGRWYDSCVSHLQT